MNLRDVEIALYRLKELKRNRSILQSILSEGGEVYVTIKKPNRGPVYIMECQIQTGNFPALLFQQECARLQADIQLLQSKFGITDVEGDEV